MSVNVTYLQKQIFLSEKWRHNKNGPHINMTIKYCFSSFFGLDPVSHSIGWRDDANRNASYMVSR